MRGNSVAKELRDSSEPPAERVRVQNGENLSQSLGARGRRRPVKQFGENLRPALMKAAPCRLILRSDDVFVLKAAQRLGQRALGIMVNCVTKVGRIKGDADYVRCGNESGDTNSGGVAGMQ